VSFGLKESMLLKFKTWLEQNTVGTHNDYATGAYVSTDWSGSRGQVNPFQQGQQAHLSKTDVMVPGVPTRVIRGRIEIAELKTNPCFIQLSDGTKLYIPYDAISKRVQGEVKRGNMMEVTFRRHQSDGSINPSDIAWAIAYEKK
jgi:hypothetical protein